MPKHSITRYYQAPMGHGRTLELIFSEKAKDIITGTPFSFQDEKEMRLPHNISLNNFSKPEDVFFGSTDTTHNLRVIGEIENLLRNIRPDRSIKDFEETITTYEALFYLTEIVEPNSHRIKEQFALQFMLLPIFNTLVGANAVIQERQKNLHAENTSSPGFFKR